MALACQAEVTTTPQKVRSTTFIRLTQCRRAGRRQTRRGGCPYNFALPERKNEHLSASTRRIIVGVAHRRLLAAGTSLYCVAVIDSTAVRAPLQHQHGRGGVRQRACCVPHVFPRGRMASTRWWRQFTGAERRGGLEFISLPPYYKPPPPAAGDPPLLKQGAEGSAMAVLAGQQWQRRRVCDDGRVGRVPAEPGRAGGTIGRIFYA